MFALLDSVCIYCCKVYYSCPTVENRLPAGSPSCPTGHSSMLSIQACRLRRGRDSNYIGQYKRSSKNPKSAHTLQTIYIIYIYGGVYMYKCMYMLVRSTCTARWLAIHYFTLAKSKLILIWHLFFILNRTHYIQLIPCETCLYFFRLQFHRTSWVLSSGTENCTCMMSQSILEKCFWFYYIL